MYLKSLTLTRDDGYIIRDIRFRVGLNLIVDETPLVDSKKTGNNVGKTTVLKLVDFCLGGEAKPIYTDPEDMRQEYKLVKEYLIGHKVLVTLILKGDLLQESAKEVVIERNFLARQHKIQRIDGVNKTVDEFNETLTSLLFPGHYGNKPTFRQIIAHNIRYTDQSISNTLKNINAFTRDDEYETLYLFLFGCNFEQGNAKQALRAQLDIEEKFKKRLEAEQTKSGYETALALLESEIEELERCKARLNLNPHFEADLDKLNGVKYQINVLSSELGRLELRKRLVLEAQQDIQAGVSTVDVQQLQQIYQQATALVGNVQKTFQELNDFHNKMVEAKARFIAQDLPKINMELTAKREHLNRLLTEEAELSAAIRYSDAFEVLEQLIAELNAKHHKKGDYENTLRQLHTVEAKLADLGGQLAEIDQGLFSEVFAEKITAQLNKFNRHFSAVSYELYGEKYALKYDTKTVKGRRLYKFTPYDLNNFSSGKKQGEVSCFDIAYTLFADEEHIPCMHFLLNDKKELMHDNQLLNLAKLANAKGVQFVVSILKDKLPEELDKADYVVVKLSQENKLFRIEAL